MENRIQMLVNQIKKSCSIKATAKWGDLVNIASQNGISLLTYEDGEQIINTYKLESKIKKIRAFAYTYKNRSVVLYKDYLKGYQLMYAVAHELGHLILKHEETDDILSEIEADEFARCLIGEKKDYLKHILLGLNALLLITSIILVVLLVQIRLNKSYNNDDYYVSLTGKKYHKSDCHFVDEDYASLTPEQIKKIGYEPCKTCHD